LSDDFSALRAGRFYFTQYISAKELTMTEPKGNKYGLHRVIEPAGVLPQPAKKVNNDMSVLYDNEIMCEVDTLNVDSASFHQIKEQAGRDPEKIKEIMLSIVADAGKHKNP
jgi:L-erythro-3,5-diaminohexanoate dehydrogenase